MGQSDLSSVGRNLTRKIHVGSVTIGGGAPVSVQSMCNTKTTNAKATLAQIQQLSEAGCEIVRVSLPQPAAINSFSKICAESPLPVVADIHFDWRLAIAAIDSGASAVRINPGNIGSLIVWMQLLMQQLKLGLRFVSV
jgi:(E)-4-hydroxy-3-methylbut-2-enyl-diphosphate synthase